MQNDVEGGADPAPEVALVSRLADDDVEDDDDDDGGGDGDDDSGAYPEPQPYSMHQRELRHFVA